MHPLSGGRNQRGYTPAELLALVNEFGQEAQYVAIHIVKRGENIATRLRVLYHYLARAVEFQVDDDTSTVLIGGRRRQWDALDSLETVHGVD